MARSELERWKADHPHANADPADFAPIREALTGVTLGAIVTACNTSKAAASGWRSGRYVPAMRHWPALAKLGGVVWTDEWSPTEPQEDKPELQEVM